MADDPRQGDATPDYDTWFNSAPEEFRSRLREQTYKEAYGSFNSALEQEFGDILPLVVDAKADPQFRKTLTRLKDKGVRDLYGTALDTYDRAGTPAGGARDDNPLADEVRQIRENQVKAEQQAQWDKYTAARDREFLALQNEYSQLRGNAKLGAHIREIAEARTMQNLRNGNAQAVPYKDVFDEWQALSKEEPPPAAPQLSAAGVSERPQAPRTAAEGRARALDLVKNAGGFSRLQASLAARGRG